VARQLYLRSGSNKVLGFALRQGEEKMALKHAGVLGLLVAFGVLFGGIAGAG
jgi:hypothetical protein